MLIIDKRGDSCGYDISVARPIQNIKNQLHNQHHQNLMDIISCPRRKSEYKQVYLDRLENARLAYELARDPDYLIKKAEREAKLRDPGYWKQLTNNFFNGFAKFYLRNFVLAFFLLLIWKHENKEEKGINPLSFLLMWAIYPISIFVVFMRKFGQNTKQWAFYLVLRRRSVNLFSLFSDDEIRDIKALAKTMKIKEYREKLRLEEFEIRHSLVAASLATLILGTLNVLPLELISKNLDLQLEIGSEIDCFKEDGSILKILATDLNSLEKGSDNETKDDQTLNPIFSLAILPDKILEPILAELKLSRAIINYNLLSGFKNNPDHVPLFFGFNNLKQIINFKKKDMRHIIVIIIVALASFITSAELKAQEKVENQDFRFSGISFSAGEGMVSSGLYATISATSTKMVVEATAAGDQACVNAFWRVGSKLLIGPSMGHNDNTPFLGGIALFQPTKYLSTFHWFAYTAGELGAETIHFNESAFAFMANQISLKVKRVSLNYSLVHFLKYEPMHGIGIRYSQPLGEEVLIYGDATYKVGQKMLFQIGMAWKRK